MAENNDPQSLESRLNAVVAPIDQPPADATQQKLNEVAAPATDDHLAERLKAVSAPIEQPPAEQVAPEQIKSAAMGVGGEFALPYLSKSDPENLSTEEKQAIVNLDGKNLSDLLKANKGIKLSDVSTKDLVPMYRKLQEYEDHSPESETHPIANAAKGVANDIVEGLHGVKTFASDLGNALYLNEPAEGEAQTPESQRLKEVYKDFFTIGDKTVGAVRDLYQLGSKINEGGMKLADDLGIGIHPTSGILTIQHKTPTEKLINRITRDEIDANRERVKAKVPSNIGQVLYYAGEKPTDRGQQSYAQLLRPILASYLVPSVKQRMLDNPNLTEGEATQQFIQDSDQWGSSALQEYAKELPKPKQDVGTAAEFLLPQYTTTFGIGAEGLGALTKGAREGARLSEVEQLMPQAQAMTDTAQTAREGGTFYVDPQGNVHAAPKSSTGPRTKEQLREDWNNAEQLHTDNLKTIDSDIYERAGGNVIRLGPWNIPKPFVWAGAGSDAANNTADAIKKAATTGALATALPVTTGAIGAYQNRNQGLLGMGAGFLKGVEYGAAGELAGYGALKTAGKGLGVLSDLGKVSAGLKGTGGNVFQIAGNLPTSTDLTKEIFGGKVGKITAPVANWMANNLVNWGYEGVQAGVLAGAMGVFDSTPYEDLPEQAASGAAMMMMPHILTSAIHETPSSREKRIQEENNRINQVKAQASPESIKTAAQFSDYREVVNNQKQIADDKVQKLRETLANPKAKPEEIKQATQEAKEADQKLTQVMSANSETRLEYGRQNDLLWANIHRGLNGPLLAGQGNIGLEILTKDQILQKLVDQNKELASTPQGMAKLEMIASQDGMVINSAGGVELRIGTDLAEALKKEPILFDPSKTTAIINADNARTRAGVYGTTTYDALSHEGGHLYGRTEEFQKANSDLLSQLFSTNIYHDDGTIAAEDAGAVSNDQLKDMIWNNYLKGRTDEQKKAWLESQGMWDRANDRFIDKEVIPYAREEYIAEMAGNSLHQMTSRGGETAVMKWARTSASNNTLARAIQAVLGHGGPDPTKPSPVMGIQFTPEIAAATEKAIQAVNDYNGHIAPVIDAQPVVEITQQELKKNKGLLKKYGIQSGMFQTQVFATIRDAKGNVVSKVAIPSESTPEGSWKIDPATGKPVQTKGYGQIPDEVSNVQIPEGGSLDVQREVAMQPDGESPIMLSDSQIKKNQKARRDLILNALGITGEIPEQGITWRGTFTPEQIQNIKNLPENVVPKAIKDVILSMNETLASGEGKRWLAEYSPTSGKKGKRKSLMMKQYDVVPIGMHFTKDGNFNVTVISATRLFNKIHAWGAEFPHILDMWGGSKSEFFNDFVTKYLANWQKGKEGWEGLDPNEDIAKQKRDIFNNFLNLKDKDTDFLNQNRFYLKGKLAELDRTIMSMRADHVSSLQPSNAQPIPVDYYKAKINAMPESGLPYQERPEESEEALKPLTFAPKGDQPALTPDILKGISAVHVPAGSTAQQPSAQKTGISFMPSNNEDAIHAKAEKNSDEKTAQELVNKAVEKAWGVPVITSAKASDVSLPDQIEKAASKMRTAKYNLDRFNGWNDDQIRESYEKDYDNYIRLVNPVDPKNPTKEEIDKSLNMGLIPFLGKDSVQPIIQNEIKEKNKAEKEYNDALAELNNLKSQDLQFKTGNPVTIQSYHATPFGELEGGGFDPEKLGTNTKAGSATLAHFMSGSESTANAYIKGDSLPHKGFLKLSSSEKDDLMRYLGDRYEEDVRYGKEQIKQDSQDEGLSEEDTHEKVDDFLATQNFTNWLEHYPSTAIRDDVGDLFNKDYDIDPVDPKLYKLFVHFDNPMVVDQKGARYREISYYDALKDAQKKGHDGVIFVNTYDGGPRDNIFAVLKGNENKIKSSDPFTYDENKKLIPLSQRFNPSTNKIAFMPSRDEEPESITEATYTNPRTGEVSRGATHRIANPNAPQEATDRESPAYGFATDKGRIVDRNEAYNIAQAADQLKEPTTEEQKFHADRGVLHSDMVNYEGGEKSNDNRRNVGISFMPKEDEEYAHQTGHRPPNEKYGAPMHEVTRGIYPDDFYTLPYKTALRYYGMETDKADNESMTAIRSVQGKPDAEITIYRAVPKSIKDAQIYAGDWVTPSRTYAKEHGEAWLKGDYTILSKKVPASHLFTEGNSINEFGYNPPKKSGISFMPSKLDEAHAKAIESGDTEEAQRLVDEAARKAGYDLSHREGYGQDWRKKEDVILFAKWEPSEMSKNDHYGPANYIIKSSDLKPVPEWAIKWHSTQPEIVRAAEEDKRTALEIARDSMNPNDIVDGAGMWDSRKSVRDFYNDNESRLYKEGTIGYLTPDGAVIFDPYSAAEKGIAKLADPATYDDQGNLIPLSQRFNPASNDIRFMPANELPKTEDGSIDWEGFKTKAQEVAKPLAALSPIGGIRFMPAPSKQQDIKMKPSDDGRTIVYNHDPKTTIKPATKSIKKLIGEVVGMLEADRHNTLGDNMGGPMHPFLISNQVIARLKDGRGFKPVWANMNSAFVTRAKNIIKNTTSGRALIQLMKEEAHISNRKFVRDVMSELDKKKDAMPKQIVDSLHVILELGARNPATKLKEVTKAKKAFKDGEITQRELNKVLKDNKEAIDKYGPMVDFLSKLGSIKSKATRGNIESFNKSYADHIKQYQKQDWYKKIADKYKNTAFADEASRFTFNQRGAAMKRLRGIAHAPDIGKMLADSMDFKGGKNLDLVASVQLSKDPDAFAIYTGNDPKQEAKMSENERYLRDQFLKNKNFRKHPSYDWMMLGPEKADNFILEKPVDPLVLFPDYAKSHPNANVRNGSKETIVGTMKKSKIPLKIK